MPKGTDIRHQISDIRFRISELRRNISDFRLLTSDIRPAFTLIELLITIAIIGILSSITIYSYRDSQRKSRDSRRKSDVESIRKALELAKQDSAGNYTYPSCDTYSTNDGITNSCTITDTGTNPDLASTYIKKVPTDPSSSSTYYIYAPIGSINPCVPSTCTTYNLRACLENSNDSQKDGTDTCASTSTVSYTVQNF